jgi:Holliday junction resolvasome RuvABC endonuclease subunit
MKRIYGIDISTTKIAVARLVENDFSVIEFRARTRSWETRLAQLYKDFFSYVEEEMTSDDFVCIEDIPMVQNRQSLIKLVHTLAMCRVVCFHHEIDCFPVNVSTWKKDVVGDGRADKDKIRMMALQIFGKGIEKFSQDSIDALMIAKWGQLRFNSLREY